MLLLAASWAISVYYAYQRTWKPFNPILGETYEMVNHGGISFIAEQVSFWDCDSASYSFSLCYSYARMSHRIFFHFRLVIIPQ